MLDGSAGYRFLHVDDGTGLPARFNPCEPVAYVVNPSGAPAGAVEDVHEAFRRASLASGIRFVYEGETDEGPNRSSGYMPDRYGERWAPVLVVWGARTGLFETAGGQAVGLASPETVTSTGRQDVIVSGVILLARDGPAVTPGFGAGRRWGNVALHEIGHVLGLDHVQDRGQVMAPHMGYDTGQWGEGDLAGLAHLGRQAGCLRVPRAAAL